MIAQPLIKNTTVKLNLIHNISSNKMCDIRFDLTSTIYQVKQSIEKRYGTSCDTMELVLQDKEGNNLCCMSDNTQMLGFYSPQDGYTIHVLDLNPNSVLKDLEDLSQVEKYVMSEEDYDKLPDNFRKFKQKLFQSNPANNKYMVSNPAVDPDFMQAEASKLQVGQRCKVIETGYRGVIKYVGKIPTMGLGFFVGIQLDEPFGKNDGSHISVKYFECLPKYGLFLRPNKIEQGNFPELNLEDEI